MSSGRTHVKSATPVAGAQPYRVMIVDDSAVVRGLLARMLESDPAIKVAASVSNGEMAVKSIARHDPDVVILDIEMPVMDGLTALPKLTAIAPNVKIVVASTLTVRNAEISLKCLANGADDYLAKPTSMRDLGAAENFKHDLLAKVKALGAARRGGATEHGTATPARRGTPAPAQPAAPIALRQPSRFTPKIIAVGSSTGGPQALFKFFGGLDAAVRVPILVTQHMPPTFTQILAEHIAKVCRRPACEGAEGQIIEDGHIYVAPGDHHMVVDGDGPEKKIRINRDPPENFCRPAVDPMLRSVAAAYGPRALTIILTGMGQDGCAGSKEIVEAGGTVIAQDEETSVVWGMPGAAAMAGVCSALLPIDEMAPYVTRFMTRTAQ